MAEPLIETPCVSFPKPLKFSVPLPFGGALSAITNIADGPPTDCALVHSLMLQLAPMLAGMTCILRILAVIKAMEDFVSSPLNPDNAKKLLDKIAVMTECLGMLDPCNIILMIESILQMIIAYLSCLIEAFESILNFQIGIDLNAAEGNPVLLTTLQCAQDNAQTAMDSLNDSMQGIMPLMQLVNMLLDIAGQSPIEMPAMKTPTPAEIAGGADPMGPVKGVRDALLTAYNTLAEICPPE
jgi:hypothetical protein